MGRKSEHEGLLLSWCTEVKERDSSLLCTLPVAVL